MLVQKQAFTIASQMWRLCLSLAGLGGMDRRYISYRFYRWEQTLTLVAKGTQRSGWTAG
ncbi:hypothetical protein [Rosenbergiella epipactidis]|uniref:hypothetical protein n=1 Tax=Rosenbergiella epipactidis TaxID=1544694 RepID=UPI001F4E5592|nr:hypothetical protein [Rosenbergiella epipactidis]